MKKLKDKVWRNCTIKIDRLVEQTKDSFMTTNKTIAFLVTIDSYGSRTMFRADSTSQLWFLLKQECFLEPIKVKG